ncbi:MAG: proton-conducting transporter membrane subunit [Acidimicrobiia bacterium]|nr:proton-conducting transporter membrane subunit [Acidimicrobiia bacterium]
MILVLLLHLLVAIALAVFHRRLDKRAFLLGAVGPAATLLWSLANYDGVVAGAPVEQLVSWVPSLDLDIVFRVDAYALVFLLVIAGAGVPIFLYSQRYFTASRRATIFAATMTVFAGAMVGLVAADHLLALFVFWELTTISSYLLIGYKDEEASARSAALHAALVTGAGGLAMLGGMVLLANEAGTYVISELTANPPPATTAVSVGWALVLIGAVTKSAQFPFHAWLPGAMAAPTPASAFLHSATMVKAGIFLVGRLGVAAAGSVDWWQPVVLTLGATTMVLGGWRALRQTDLKLLLAFGTVSQLGFIFLLMGSGDPELVFGGVALLLSHALFKATLFLVVGAIDHETGTRDLRRLSGLRRSMPGLFWVATAASLSMAAVPLMLGFAAKEAAFVALLDENVWWVAIAAAASTLTVAYTVRFLRGAFGDHDVDRDPVFGRRLSAGDPLLTSPGALALASVVLGLVPTVLFPLTDAATAAVTGVAKAGKLVVWPGWVPALAWSLASLAGGLFLAGRSDLMRRAGDRVATVSSHLPDAEHTYRRSIPALLRFADRSSSVLQNGSLPAYLAIILIVAVVAPTVAVLTQSPSFAVPEGGSLLEWILGGLIIGFAVALAFIRRRFAVVILLGGVGYGIAALYSVFGGPDLTLTQLLVETLVIALFAFVLRHLPATFSRPVTAQLPRLAVALLVGAFVFGAGLFVNAARQPSSVAATYLEQSVPEAAGSNVVNVILVDFRAFDTLGEITVLVAAVLGAAGLVIPVIRNGRTGS